MKDTEQQSSRIMDKGSLDKEQDNVERDKSGKRKRINQEEPSSSGSTRDSQNRNNWKDKKGERDCCEENEEKRIERLQTQQEPSHTPAKSCRWKRCCSLENFHILNAIEEGSYSWVSRAQDRRTGEIVALKRPKAASTHDDEFPSVTLREIDILIKSRSHPYIVKLREIAFGELPQSAGDDGESLNKFHDHQIHPSPPCPSVYLVLEFVEHDLKSLQKQMSCPFTLSEVKTILLQLSSALAFLHQNRILHRDLKPSNILLNNRGEIRLTDFGMARKLPNPLPADLTPIVVTFWYRAPELIIGLPEYSFPIDIWSFGCIFAELLQNSPLFQGRSDSDQLDQIFSATGFPSPSTWPDYFSLSKSLPTKPLKSFSSHHSTHFFKNKFPQLSSMGINLLLHILSPNPQSRLTIDQILNHSFFSERPSPKDPRIFPTFASKAAQEFPPVYSYAKFSPSHSLS